jgi:hypothetical protein
MVTQKDYESDAVQAAREVIIELTHLLNEYRENIVLVGGWVPGLLCPNAEEPYVGSIDVDLALDHNHLTEPGYKSIEQLLKDRGYFHIEQQQPFIFHRKVTVAGRDFNVEVDFLGGEYGGTTPKHRTQPVQNIRVRKARGADLAFESPEEVVLSGILPNGGEDSVKVRVASIVPFLVMKAMALDQRLKAKDAWDIIYCLRNYPGGIDAIVAAFKLHLSHGLVQGGLKKLATRFSSVNSLGPVHLAEFAGVTDPEERDRIRREGYEQVQYLLTQLGVQ